MERNAPASGPAADSGNASEDSRVGRCGDLVQAKKEFKEAQIE